MDTPANSLTMTEISSFMNTLGYEWSNQAQTYFNNDFEFIRLNQAEKLYKIINNLK